MTSSPPRIQPSPPPPSVNDVATKMKADQAAAEAASQARARRGRASTILTQPQAARGVSLLGGGERQI